MSAQARKPSKASKAACEVVELVPATQNPRPVLPAAPLQDDSLPDTLTAQRHVGPDRPSPIPFARLTPLAAAFRFVEPTWKNYIMYVDLEARTGNPDAARYLEIYKSLSPSERNVHMPEQICDLANVPVWDLAGWVARQAFQEGTHKSAMCLSFMRDSVLQRVGEFAMESPDNYQHAKLFMTASGLMPAAPGRGSGGSPVFNANIFNQPVASSGLVALAGGKTETGPSSPSGLRSMDEEIVELSKIMQTGGTECRAEDEEREDADDDEEDDDDRSGGDALYDDEEEDDD